MVLNLITPKKRGKTTKPPTKKKGKIEKKVGHELIIYFFLGIITKGRKKKKNKLYELLNWNPLSTTHFGRVN